jgi:hypothetical protein
MIEYDMYDTLTAALMTAECCVAIALTVDFFNSQKAAWF